MSEWENIISKLEEAKLPPTGKWRNFAGALLLSVTFGALHSFSVLALPLQAEFSASLASISFGYSLAILTLTLGVYCSRYVMLRLSPARLAVACGITGGIGLVLAASGLGLSFFLAGYGVMFGFANGLAYSLLLERAADAVRARPGLAIGTVTATYAAGAAIFAPVLGALTSAASVFVALLVLAFMVAFAGIAASGLFAGSNFARADLAGNRASTAVTVRWTAILWAIYFLGASSGLMVIAHAAPVMALRGVSGRMPELAATLVAIGNMGGSILGGVWADRTAPSRAVALSVGVSAAALMVLLATNAVTSSLAAMLALGVAYGSLIAAVPVLVLKMVGETSFALAFGRIFSAWGVAGLSGPLIAGALYDYSGTYQLALLLAIIAALVGIALSLTLPSSRTTIDI